MDCRYWRDGVAMPSKVSHGSAVTCEKFLFFGRLGFRGLGVLGFRV